MRTGQVAAKRLRRRRRWHRLLRARRDRRRDVQYAAVARVIHNTHRVVANTIRREPTLHLLRRDGRATPPHGAALTSCGKLNRPDRHRTKVRIGVTALLPRTCADVIHGGVQLPNVLKVVLVPVKVLRLVLIQQAAELLPCSRRPVLANGPDWVVATDLEVNGRGNEEERRKKKEGRRKKEEGTMNELVMNNES
jgi:hypothetical protein